MLNVKLNHLDNEIAHRRKVANEYLKGINNKTIILPTKENDSAHVWHVFVIRCERRDELQKYLADNGVQTLIHYPVPPHQQPAYKEWNEMNYPISEGFHAEVLSLPIGPTMTMEDVNIVIQKCSEFQL